MSTRLSLLTSSLALTMTGTRYLWFTTREIPTNRCLTASVSYWSSDLNRFRSEARFCFSGLPARRFLISLGPSLTHVLRGLDLCPRLHLHSPRCIDHVPTLRFRVERRPRGPEGLRPSNLSIRFEAFPAVYRAPSLIWHRLVMYFQSFPDLPDF